MVPLIDEGKIDDAKVFLRVILSILVIKDMTRPLPPLRDQALLLKAEKLAENRTLTDTFHEPRNKLRIAKWLGFGVKILTQSPMIK